MNEDLYEKMKQRGNKYLELPAQHLTLVSTFNDKSRRVKRQIFVPVELGTVIIDHVLLVSPQLLTSTILGVDFFINTCAIIDFPERCALFKVDNKTTKELFEVTIDASVTINGNAASGCTQGEVFQVTTLPHKMLDSPLIGAATDLEHREFVSETDVVLDKDGRTRCCDSHAKCTDVSVHFNEYDAASWSLGVCDDDVATDFSQGMEKESSVPVSSIAEDNEGDRDGELICEYDSEYVGIIVHATRNTAVNCFRTTTGNTSHTISTNNEAPNDSYYT